jgi:hypothetical protein
MKTMSKGHDKLLSKKRMRIQKTLSLKSQAKAIRVIPPKNHRMLSNKLVINYNI